MADTKGPCWDELEDLGLNEPDPRKTYDAIRALNKQQHSLKSLHPDADDRASSATATLYTNLELRNQQSSAGGKGNATPKEQEDEWKRLAIKKWAENKSLSAVRVAALIEPDKTKHRKVRQVIAHLKPR